MKDGERKLEEDKRQDIFYILSNHAFMVKKTLGRPFDRTFVHASVQQFSL